LVFLSFIPARLARPPHSTRPPLAAPQAKPGGLGWRAGLKAEPTRLPLQGTSGQVAGRRKLRKQRKIQ